LKEIVAYSFGAFCLCHVES